MKENFTSILVIGFLISLMLCSEIFNFTYAVFRNENIELVKYYDLKNDSYENKIIKPEIIN